MENTQEKKLIQDYEREPVPADKRKGWFRLSIVWIGAIYYCPFRYSFGRSAWCRPQYATYHYRYFNRLLSALCS